MIRCTVYKCRHRAGWPCCAHCGERACPDRCENHPDRCRVWRDTAKRKQRNGVDLEMVKRLLEKGISAKEIARLAGCGTTTVYEIAKRRPTKERTGPPQRIDRERLFRLLAEGRSRREIAEELGCAYSTVCTITRKEGGGGDG